VNTWARLVRQLQPYRGRYSLAIALYAFGSVLDVVPADRLRDRALEVAADIAGKNPVVIRAAKEAFNGIDLWDVKRSYRYEQGFTFEVNLSGVAAEVRDAFDSRTDREG
jgi:enoyl-CoA hydratase